jgi:hypothetical protein
MREEETMKITGLKPKALTVLVTLALLSVSAPTLAADFLPLDVWEEMEAWEFHLTASLNPDAAGTIETIPKGMAEVEKVHLSFPFDVGKELNDLGGIKGRKRNDWKAVKLTNGTLKEDYTNPYWMPEEFRTP